MISIHGRILLLLKSNIGRDVAALSACCTGNHEPRGSTGRNAEPSPTSEVQSPLASPWCDARGEMPLMGRMDKLQQTNAIRSKRRSGPESRLAGGVATIVVFQNIITIIIQSHSQIPQLAGRQVLAFKSGRPKFPGHTSQASVDPLRYPASAPQLGDADDLPGEEGRGGSTRTGCSRTSRWMPGSSPCGPRLAPGLRPRFWSASQPPA